LSVLILWTNQPMISRPYREKWCSGVTLVATKKFTESREVEKLVIIPSKKNLELAFKSNQKMVLEALEAMRESEALEMKSKLKSTGKTEFQVCTLKKIVTITNKMVSINKEKKKL
jgi:glycyl-tRNA synthetase